MEDVIKTVDNVGGDYSEGIKCILYIKTLLRITKIPFEVHSIFEGAYGGTNFHSPILKRKISEVIICRVQKGKKNHSKATSKYTKYRGKNWKYCGKKGKY